MAKATYYCIFSISWCTIIRISGDYCIILVCFVSMSASKSVFCVFNICESVWRPSSELIAGYPLVSFVVILFITLKNKDLIELNWISWALRKETERIIDPWGWSGFVLFVQSHRSTLAPQSLQRTHGRLILPLASLWDVKLYPNNLPPEWLSLAYRQCGLGTLLPYRAVTSSSNCWTKKLDQKQDFDTDASDDTMVRHMRSPLLCSHWTRKEWLIALDHRLIASGRNTD